MLIAADGQDPISKLTDAAGSRELSTARDAASVLDYRIDPSGNHSQPPGPLPWLPAIPRSTQAQPEWAAYLTARAELIERLSEQVRQQVSGWDRNSAPRWAAPYLADRPLTSDLALWRATHLVPDTDPRPAGATPHPIADIRRHRHLSDHAIDIGGGQEDFDRWATTLARHGIDLATDDHWPILVRTTWAERKDLAIPKSLDHSTLDSSTQATPSSTGPPTRPSSHAKSDSELQ